MLTGDQILARLKDAGVRKSEIAKALAIPDSRVAELYSGKRLLKLAEAVKLVDKYELESGAESAFTPLTQPVARLLVQHVALEVGAELAPDSPEVTELAQDLRAFALFVSDPRVRDSIQAADGFLHGIRLRRLGSEASQRQERPHPSR